MAVDITQIQDATHEDEVVLIGFQGESRITVASFGEMSSQLNYELLARLPHNIPRKIV
jgi:alanine racemase